MTLIIISPLNYYDINYSLNYYVIKIFSRGFEQFPQFLEVLYYFFEVLSSVLAFYCIYLEFEITNSSLFT